MLFLAYACLAVVLIAYLRGSASRVLGASGTRARVAAAVLALGLASIGVLLLVAVEETTSMSLVLPLMLVAGGLAYAWGIVRWRAAGGTLVRWAGWILLVGALIVPSTLTLLLPVACLLVTQLREPEAAQRFGSTAPSS